MERKKYTIDRFEGEYAVCEDENGEFTDIPGSLLPDGAKAGDIIASSGDGFEINAEETEETKERIRNKMNRLFGR